MIIFKSIHFRNFLSAGDIGITIDLHRKPTTYVGGKNGRGKSMFLDAISFVLFDRSYRGVSKPQIINTINKRGTVVEIVFDVGPDTYKVIRGIKPNIFQIFKNEEMIPQDAANKDYQQVLEKEILGFNFRSLCQTCILGTANYTPFMQLSTNHRREFIESLLGIDVFTSMSLNLRGRMSEWRRNLEEVSKQIDIGKVRYKSASDVIENMNRVEEDKTSVYREKIDQIKHEAGKTIKALNEVIEQVDRTYGTRDIDNVVNGIKSKIDQIEDKIKQHNNKINSIENEGNKLRQLNTRLSQSSGENCPACKQSIPHSHVDNVVTDNNFQIEVFEKEIVLYQMEIDKLSKDLSVLNEQQSSVELIVNEITRLKNRIASLKEEGTNLVSFVQELATPELTKSIDHFQQEKNTARTELLMLADAKNALLQQGEVYTIAQQLLKDSGIKSVLINQYIPIVNQRVNHYLQIMNFDVIFELDSEFNETLKSRNYTDLSYHNLSMGERQRVDLALLFAWRDVAALKNSVNCNLLILDEIADASMDAGGTDEVLSIALDEGDRGSNIFIISHRTNLEDKLHGSITFDKVNGFTQIIT